MVVRDLHAEAEERLGRDLTAAELNIDIGGNDSVLERAKDEIEAAIEAEKKRAIKAYIDGRSRGLQVTRRMVAALLALHKAGIAAATAEIEAAGVEVPRAFAVDAPNIIQGLILDLRRHLLGISRRIDHEATALDFGSVVDNSMIRALDRRIPGARNAAADVVSKAFGSGLGITFEKVAGLFDAFLYSAVMDGGTCGPCRALDGTRFETWEAIQAVLPDGGPNPRCLGGGRCRCRPVPLGAAEASAPQPVDVPVPPAGPMLPPSIAPGKVERFERFSAIDRELVEMGLENDAEADYAALYKQLQGEVEKAGFEGPALSEAYDAIVRVGHDEILVLRDHADNMIGVVSYNPGVRVVQLRTEIEEYTQWGELTETEQAVVDRLQAQLDKEIASPSLEFGINHLASNGSVKGIGARLMQEVAKDAAKYDKGLGLNSLKEATGFYERLGFKADPAHPSNFHLSPEKTKLLANGEPDISGLLEPGSGGEYDLSLLPEYARRDVGALTHAEAKDEIKRLGTYASRLQKHVNDGTRPPTHQLKVDAMRARQAHLKERLTLPDLEGARQIPERVVAPRVGRSLGAAVKQFKDLHADNLAKLHERYWDDGTLVNVMGGTDPVGPALKQLEADVRTIGARVAAEAEKVAAETPRLGVGPASVRFTEAYNDHAVARQAFIDAAQRSGVPWDEAVNAADHDPGVAALLQAREEARRVMRAAEDATRDIRQYTAQSRSAAVSQVLAKVRPMGGKLKYGSKSEVGRFELASVKNVGGDTVNIKEARRLADLGAEFLPRAWIQTSNAFHRKLFAWLTRGRAHYQESFGRLLVSRNYAVSGAERGVTTAVHELAHRMEHVMPEIKALEWAFFMRRTAESGTRVQKMRNLAPGRGYGEHEIANGDDFTSPYTGRIYSGDATLSYPDDYFEVLSMGLQGVFTGEHSIWDLDQDHRNFVLGVLALL